MYQKIAAKLNFKRALTRKKKLIQQEGEQQDECHLLLDISELWLRHILPHLTASELLVINRVSKNFNTWGSFSFLWKAMYAKKFGVEDVNSVNTDDWKQYFLAREHFSFVGPVEVRKCSCQRNLWKRHFTKEKASFPQNVECGITTQGKLCFLDANSVKRTKDIQLSPDILILALYITRDSEDVPNSIVIEPIPVLAFITTKSLYVMEYPNIESRNRWLKEISLNVQPLVRMVLLDLIGAN